MEDLFKTLGDLFKELNEWEKLEADIKRQINDKPLSAEEFVKKLNETTIDNWSMN